MGYIVNAVNIASGSEIGLDGREMAVGGPSHYKYRLLLNLEWVFSYIP